jgi:hypothetical protein
MRVVRTKAQIEEHRRDVRIKRIDDPAPGRMKSAHRSLRVVRKQPLIRKSISIRIPHRVSVDLRSRFPRPIGASPPAHFARWAGRFVATHG